MCGRSFRAVPVRAVGGESVMLYSMMKLGLRVSHVFSQYQVVHQIYYLSHCCFLAALAFGGPRELDWFAIAQETAS